VYEYLDGWVEDISGARSLADLPTAARRYVGTVEDLCGARISAVGVGPGRDEIITVRDLV
jgi:adenylosuccinate synthase